MDGVASQIYVTSTRSELTLQEKIKILLEHYLRKESRNLRKNCSDLINSNNTVVASCW